jgi:3-oxoacyl-[acyl-carrier-protein] synthase III
VGFEIRAISSELGEAEISLRSQYPDHQKVIAKTGIERVFETRGTSVELAARAVNKLFEQNNLDRHDVDCLIYVTQSPSYFLPSGACVLQDLCGLPKSLMAFDLGQGCSGFVQALSIAAKLLDQFDNIIIVCSDIYRSKIDPYDRSTIMLFSDAASAVWLTSEPHIKILAESHMTDGSGIDFLYQKVSMQKDEYLHMSGADVLLFAKKIVPAEVEKVLDMSGLISSQISNWFFHQASKLVLDSLDLRISTQVSLLRNLEFIGNTVSSSIPILMEQHLSQLELGYNVVCGFGVGLSVASLVLGPC